MKQLQTLINRTNLKSSPKANMNAAEDFMEVVTTGHVITAAMKFFDMCTMESIPQHLQKVKETKGKGKKQKVFLDTVQEMIKEHVLIGQIESSTCHTVDNNADKVLTYAREILTLGLLLAEFKDAVKEGDGPRVIRCWKFLLPIFRAARRKNYAIQAFTLLAKRYVLLSPRLQQQLVWSRFVNVQGIPGGNIEMDLHMEHLNRITKSALGNQGSNLQPSVITRIGKISGALMSVSKQFDEVSGVTKQATSHTATSYQKDLQKIVHQLSSVSKVFENKPGRSHQSFSSVDCHITAPLSNPPNFPKFVSWMKHQLCQHTQ